MLEEKDPYLKKIVEAVKDITEGKFDNTVQVSASGIVGELASYINQTLGNLRQLDKNLGQGAKDAPLALSEVKSVSQDTEQATMAVLDHTDSILNKLGDIGGDLSSLRELCPEPQQTQLIDSMESKHQEIENAAFEIINSQGFQDITQQKISRALESLSSIEKRLIDLLIIFKIREDQDHQHENATLLKNLHDENYGESDKQNLVEQLLSEFGI